MNLGGWVLHVNECLQDASSGKGSVQSGQSGSDEERREAVVFEGSADSVKSASVSRAVETTEHSRAAPADLSLDPCLFYSYTDGCAKGDECEYSHSVHADEVAAPVAKQKRGHARHRIKKRLTPSFCHGESLRSARTAPEGSTPRLLRQRFYPKSSDRGRFVHIGHTGTDPYMHAPSTLMASTALMRKYHY